MKHAKKRIIMILAFGLVSSIGIIGCSSKPTQDELTQLDNVKAEINSKSSLEKDQAMLTQSIADKQAQLKTCQSGINAVKEKLHE